MADKYAYMIYTGLSAAVRDQVAEHVKGFNGTGASISSLEGGETTLRINAGGPNSQGYVTALRAQINAQIGVTPTTFETNIPIADSHVVTGDDRRGGH